MSRVLDFNIMTNIIIVYHKRGTLLMVIFLDRIHCSPGWQVPSCTYRENLKTSVVLLAECHGLMIIIKHLYLSYLSKVFMRSSNYAR